MVSTQHKDTTNISGRVIIVTGAGGGIGLATSKGLAARGAQVIMTDITDETQALADAISDAGHDAHFIKADIGVESDVESLVAETVKKFGRLDGAFNNAGVEQCATPLADLTSEQWNRAIHIDLTAVFYCLKYQIIAMLKTGGGSIVNTASALGAVALQNASEYVSAKHGVTGLTKSAAADYGAQGIRVNAVLPGIIKTPMVARIEGEPGFAAFFDQLRARHPIGRFGEPDEVGESVAWLLSDAASFINGAMISVDGGYLAV